MREVLKLGAFRRLMTAYALTLIAWWVGNVTLTLLVYKKTGSAIGAAGFFLCAQFVPALLSPFLVARIDQRASRLVLAALYALEALAFIALSRLVSHFSLVAVLALVLVDGAMFVSALALTRSVSVRVTSAVGLLREGNAVAQSVSSTCFLVGPALGGLVVAVGGTAVALLGSACLFALIALTFVTATSLPEPPSERSPLTGRARAAFAYATKSQEIRRILGVQAVALALFTIAVPVEVVLVRHSLHSGASGYGVLLSSWGGGALLGSAIYARWRSRPGREFITLAACLLGVGYCVMAAAPSLGLAIAGAAIGGIGNGMEFVAVRTLLQEHTEEAWMAMMMSFTESLTEAVPGVGIVIGGAIAALAGPRPAMAVAGAGSLVIAGVVWVMLRPSSGRDRSAPLPPLPTEPRHEVMRSASSDL